MKDKKLRILNLILILLLIPVILFSQQDSTKIQSEYKDSTAISVQKDSIMISTSKKGLQKIEPGQLDSTKSMSSWKLSDDYLSKEYVEIDTSLVNFQLYNPVFTSSFGNAFLGNMGSAVESQLFFDRYNKNEFYFLNYYHPYLETVDKTTYFNTKRQYTRLSYINGGTNSIKEEHLEAFHTQNVSPTFNFGFKIYTVKSLGQYLAQRTGRTSFKGFASYEGKAVQSFFNINTNTLKINENGGIFPNDTMFSDVDTDPEEVPVIFGDSDPGSEESDVRSTFKDLSFELLTNVDFLRLFSRKDVDSSETEAKGPKSKLGMLYIAGYESNKRIFLDINPAIGIANNFYDTVFFNATQTFDSIRFQKFSNSLRMYFTPFQNNTAFAGLTHEWQRAYFHSRDESKINKYEIDKDDYIPFSYSYPYSNVVFNSGIDLSFFNLFWKIRGDYYLAGYRTGNFNLDGLLSYIPPSKNSILSAQLNISFKDPSYFYSHSFSNSFIWNNNFKPAKNIHLSINYSHSPKKFETNLDFALLRDIIYFDTNAYPRQYNDEIEVLSGAVKKDFRFWKITSINKIALQYVNKASVINIPEVVFYNSTFFQQRVYFNFTGGEFFMILGFDMFYNTKYFAPAYMPHTGGFYNQNETKLGNYPFVDIFLNLKLKRARFFFKFEHINSGLLDKNYFSVLRYPRNERMFKLGISWNFYD